MHIRAATAADADAIASLDAAGLGSCMRRAYLEDAVRVGHCHVAEIDGEVRAFAVLDRSFFGRQFLELLVVDPSYRRQGVGRALVTHAEQRCDAELIHFKRK